MRTPVCAGRHREIAVVPAATGRYWKVPEGTRRWKEHEIESSLRPLEKMPPHQHLEIYFKLLASRTVEEYISVVLKHHVGGNLLQ